MKQKITPALMTIFVIECSTIKRCRVLSSTLMLYSHCGSVVRAVGSWRGWVYIVPRFDKIALISMCLFFFLFRKHYWWHIDTCTDANDFIHITTKLVPRGIHMSPHENFVIFLTISIWNIWHRYNKQSDDKTGLKESTWWLLLPYIGGKRLKRG